MKKPLFFVAFTANILVFGCFNATLAAENAQDTAESKEQRTEHPHSHYRKQRMERRHAKMLEKVDTNQDGMIDLNEYLSNAEARFNKMDLDGNGFVTREEQIEAHKLMREKHKEMRKEWRKKHRDMHQQDDDN